MDILIVVDMQNDFVSGALGTQEAFDIVPYVVGRVVEGIDRGEEILFTRDTHGPDYLDTQEGKHLPVPHCIRGTEGWEIIPQLQPDTMGRTIVDKPTFGSRALGEELVRLIREHRVDELVMGFPRNMDGTEGPRAQLYREFARQLEEASGLPVVLWDERRTTVDAHRILFEAGQNAKKRKKTVDAVAASLILEGYLDARRLRNKQEGT